ncbi:uncharacterized protein METZ01_LOCUS261070, partial [marine metagenome]
SSATLDSVAQGHPERVFLQKREVPVR